MLGVLEEFDDVIMKKSGFECLEGLAANMTNPDPLKRLKMVARNRAGAIFVDIEAEGCSFRRVFFSYNIQECKALG